MYEMTELIEINDYTLFCPLAQCDPVTYEEVFKITKWQKGINDDLKLSEEMTCGS